MVQVEIDKSIHMAIEMIVSERGYLYESVEEFVNTALRDAVLKTRGK